MATATAVPAAPAKRPVAHLPHVPPPMRLRASAGRRALEMTLRDLRVDVDVVGLAAEVTLILTFHNPHKRELEGELLLPLPEGATVCGYGLDVEGELVDASLVERDRARVAFEAEVRRPKIIDPGLAEAVQGSVFRTRIFPLPPRGQRQVKVQYVTELTILDGQAVLDVPLATTGPLRTFEARITVPADVSADLHGHGWAGSGFTLRDGKRVTEVHRRDTEPQSLRVVLPALPAGLVRIEAGEDGQRYFAIHRIVDDGEAAALPPPESATAMRIVWDASLSRGMADLRHEFDLLRHLLRRLDDATIELLVFRNEPEEPQTFAIIDGDATPLLEHVRALVYDGGTSLRAAACALNRGGDHAFAVLFTDGIETLTAADVQFGNVGHQRPIYAVTSSQHANHALLHHAAERAGGELLNLLRMDAETAAARVGVRSYVLRAVDVMEGEVADLQPAAGATARGPFTLTGRLVSTHARLRLRFGPRDGAGVDEVTADYTLDGADAPHGRIIPRLWAQQRVAALSAEGSRRQQEMIQLGRRFGLVTPSTSLLVLETLWQHIEHRVEPAVTRRVLYEQYHEHLASRSRDDEEDETPRFRDALAADERTRRDLIGLYARLRMGDDVDVESLVQQTAGMTAAQIVRTIDDATFMMRSDGRTQIELRDLMSAGLWLRVMRNDNPLRSGWVSRVAWWRRPAPALPSMPIETVAPDKTWDPWWMNESLGSLSDSRFRSIDRSRDASIDKTMDRTIDTLGDVATFPAGPPSAASDFEVRPRAAVPWDASRIREIRDGDLAEHQAERQYIRQRASHAADPDFYADWADLFLSHGWRRTGLRVLSNLAEVELEDVPNLRAMAYRLEAAGEDARAADAYSQVLRLRPEEPQSHRDMAHVLARLGQVDRAVELLTAVAHGRWDRRFRGIEGVALTELNALRAAHDPTFRSAAASLPTTGVDLRQVLDFDVRITLDWNADATDLDLWVIEPTGELCNGFTRDGASRIGGFVPRDVRGGYGPEEYLLRQAPPGKYGIRVRDAGTDQRRVERPTTMKVTVWRNFGRPDETRRAVVLRHARRVAPLDRFATTDFGCTATLISVAALIFGLLAAQWWLVLVAAASLVVLWVGARLMRRIAKRHRTEGNVVDVMQLTV